VALQRLPTGTAGHQLNLLSRELTLPSVDLVVKADGCSAAAASQV